MDIKYFAIIVAAGLGQRMRANTPKQYLPLAGLTVLEHALQPFLASALIQKIVVVLAADDKQWQHLAISQHKKIITAVGGAERIDSCLNGLNALQDIAGENDWVLDHDAARPCFTVADLANLISQLANEKIGGLAAYPAVDTMKRSDEDQHVVTTVDRKNLWHAATPQVFRYGLFRQALHHVQAHGKMVTDSAQAFELLGYHPTLFKCPRRNIKITEPGDLELAEFYLGKK